MNIDERRREVWAAMADIHPEFTREHDLFDDPLAVQTLLLGDFLGFTPFAGARCMDVGANAGIVTAWLALRDCIVTAYEADPMTHSLTMQMLRLSHLTSRVDLINAAVWTYTGHVPFEGRGYRSELAQGRNGSIQVLPNGIFFGNTSNTEGSPQVPCVSFERAIGMLRWDFVKMDIEGAEFQVLLATPDESLAMIDLLQVEFHNGWANDEVYGQVIEKLGKTFDAKGPQDGNGRFHHAQFTRRK